jgi:hypothetical protein
MRNRTFSGDLGMLYSKLQNREVFSFSKYADGEYEIIKNRSITNCDGWTFNPKTDNFYYEKLVESFQYKNPSYFVGVSCPCCVGDPIANDMRSLSNQDDTNLTWANIFVNGNYKEYINKYLPMYSKYEVALVANKESSFNNLPFKVSHFYPIGDLAWKNDYHLIDEIKNDIVSKGMEGCLFLFCAGPLGNMMAHQLFDAHPQNTYMDIGSTLNVHLLGHKGINRGYLKGEGSLSKVCTW